MRTSRLRVRSLSSLALAFLFALSLASCGSDSPSAGGKGAAPVWREPSALELSSFLSPYHWCGSENDEEDIRVSFFAGSSAGSGFVAMKLLAKATGQELESAQGSWKIEGTDILRMGFTNGARLDARVRISSVAGQGRQLEATRLGQAETQVLTECGRMN